MDWIKYSENKPRISDLVLIYRDIESKQMYVSKWSEEDEKYAEMNEITNWCHISHPKNK
jgi:hypothetical protein